MRLDDTIRGLSSDNTVVELQQMLTNPKVGISWYGRRVVSVKGYEGEMELRELALKYFAAKPFQCPETASTFSERWECYSLYATIQELFLDGAEAFEKTWIRYVLPYKEWMPYNLERTRERLFTYTLKQLEEAFPNDIGCSERIRLDGTILYVPGWGMIQSAVSRLNLSSS
ncbi:MAG: hypothetical protein K940chlam6_00437 [Chlamydiae bacterium]|nr:hypothetical protein [Chlamydiota bacterium]